MASEVVVGVRKGDDSADRFASIVPVISVPSTVTILDDKRDVGKTLKAAEKIWDEIISWRLKRLPNVPLSGKSRTHGGRQNLADVVHGARPSTHHTGRSCPEQRKEWMLLSKAFGGQWHFFVSLFYTSTVHIVKRISFGLEGRI